MKRSKEIMKFFGRLLIVLIFLVSGISKIIGFDGTIDYMSAYGVTFAAAFLLAVAIVIELGGSLLVIFGYKTKLGALLLLIYTIIVTLIFHLDFADQIQFTMFLKNIAIIGGLLYVLGEGPGYISFDVKRNRIKKV